MEEDCFKQGSHKKKVKRRSRSKIKNVKFRVMKEEDDTDTSNFDDEEAKEQNENNRYYMPEYYKCFREKNPYIVMWSNILLGYQTRHSNNYNDGEVGKGPRNFIDLNTPNVYAEQFFNMKNPC